MMNRRANNGAPPRIGHLMFWYLHLCFWSFKLVANRPPLTLLFASILLLLTGDPAILTHRQAMASAR